jgi:phosphate transport system ATP-binding protein
MDQARRASDECVYMLLGKIVEHGPTAELFLNPQQPETADFIEGRYG